jgi:8-oxo-dGTP diphosphatase
VKEKARILGWDQVGTVRAAGGIVTRPGPGGLVEVVIVHRPGYEDWTLPKGKLDPGETDEEAALREVDEETGFRCRLLEELPSVSYTDRHGRPKVVRYWLMEREGGEFRPNHEVDEVRWVGGEEARRLLTHDRDRELVAEALRRA